MKERLSAADTPEPDAGESQRRPSTLRPMGPWAVPPPGQPLMFLAPELFRDKVVPLNPALPAQLFEKSASGLSGVFRPELGNVLPDLELPRVGSVIEKYRLEMLLGVGGFAAVYRATHLLLRTPVAIKVPLPRWLRRKPALADALCQEARYAARISHPNVVRVLDVTHDDDLTFLVMEYIDGLPLSTIIRTASLSVARTLRVGLDVAAGLQAGLEQGLVHRDVKPSNIILSESGISRLVDFGLATHSAEAHRSWDDVDEPVLVGTYGYMAPETTLGLAFDARSDIYSLGVTLFRAMTGRLPFDNRDRRTCLRRQREEPAPLASSCDSSISTEVSDLLASMLERQPQARPQTYAELSQAIQRALAATSPNPKKPDES